MSLIVQVQGNKSVAAKYKVGMRGYWITSTGIFKIDGKPIIFTITEISKKVSFQKEPEYWCKASVGGSMPILESEFKPL